MLVEGFDQLPRLGEICWREDLAGLAPGHDLAREQQRCREMRAHLIDIVQRASTVRPSSCQRRMRAMRSATVLVSTARNGSSSRRIAASCGGDRGKGDGWTGAR